MKYLLVRDTVTSASLHSLSYAGEFLKSRVRYTLTESGIGVHMVSFIGVPRLLSINWRSSVPEKGTHEEEEKIWGDFEKYLSAYRFPSLKTLASMRRSGSFVKYCRFSWLREILRRLDRAGKLHERKIKHHKSPTSDEVIRRSPSTIEEFNHGLVQSAVEHREKSPQSQ